jgi:hypothetical protein
MFAYPNGRQNFRLCVLARGLAQTSSVEETF